ncbi:MAG: hypothetical protein D6730_07875 [Bacteroidetes bacterium]|nr:MAG: hypothetical protein D6730_07875 [Bacteroidota bacterium]
MTPKLKLRYFLVKTQEAEYWKEKESTDFLLFKGLQEQLKESPKIQIATEDPQALEVIIAYASHSALADPQCYDKLVGDERLRPVSEARISQQYAPVPMLVVGTDDIMQGLDKQAMQTAYPRSERKAGSHLHESDTIKAIRKFIDPRYRFWDSSIWHWYVPVLPVDTFVQRLEEALEDIGLQRNLYNKIVSKEYLEFQCRKLKNSYFIDLVSGHAKKVTPYRFHAESNMKRKANKLIKALRGYTWGCIIIDDYFKKPLREDLDGPKPKPGKTGSEPHAESKIPLIEKLLNRRKTPAGKKGKDIIKVLSRQWEDKKRAYITNGMEQMQHFPAADIILLDYFFGMGEAQKEEQYGHYLLRRMLKDQEARKKQTEEESENTPAELSIAEAKPFDKHWIFPISVFDYAFNSHLIAMGINRIGRYMEIADGADPVNTPQLFRYLFYSFLESYRTHIGLSLDTLLKDMNTRLQGSGSAEQLKQVFRDAYPHIAEINTRIQKLKEKADLTYTDRDEPHESMGKETSWFASSYLHEIDPQNLLPTICLHFQHLAYLIVYGLGSDWARMWEETQLIRRLVHAVKYDQAKYVKDTADDAIELLNKTDAYIIKLRQQFP